MSPKRKRQCLQFLGLICGLVGNLLFSLLLFLMPVFQVSIFHIFDQTKRDLPHSSHRMDLIGKDHLWYGYVREIRSLRILPDFGILAQSDHTFGIGNTSLD